MIINLEEVFSLGKSVKIDDYFININGDILSRKGIKDCKAKVSGVVKRVADEVYLNVSVSLKFTCLCDSCLECVNKEFDYLFSHKVICSDVQSDDLGCINVSSYKLDLDSVIIEDIILEFPSKILCHDDCLGLCQQCGKNLNHGMCGCTKGNQDPRLEVLKGLLD